MRLQSKKTKVVSRRPSVLMMAFLFIVIVFVYSGGNERVSVSVLHKFKLLNKTETNFAQSHAEKVDSRSSSENGMDTEDDLEPEIKGKFDTVNDTKDSIEAELLAKTDEKHSQTIKAEVGIETEIKMSKKIELALVNETNRETPQHLDILYYPGDPVPRSDDRDGMTIVIPTYKRERNLLYNNALRDYAALDIVDRILIMWNDVDTFPSQSVLNHFSQPLFRGKVVIFMHQRNSLLNRFNTTLVRTRAIFSLDDDQCIRPSQLGILFESWKKNPDRFVGSYTRQTICTEERCSYGGGSRGTFNLLLPGGGMVTSKANYERIFSDSLTPAREWVDNHLNCEDILANLSLPKVLSKKIYVPVKRCQIPHQKNKKGISSKRGHLSLRHSCVTYFRDLGLYIPPLQMRVTTPQ